MSQSYPGMIVSWSGIRVRQKLVFAQEIRFVGDPLKWLNWKKNSFFITNALPFSIP